MRRYLVVANQTLASDQLKQELLLRAEAGESLFHFVVPNTASKDYAADSVPAGAEAARLRLKEALDVLRAAGANAWGAVSDPDPLRAVELQMKCSAYDEVIVSMLPDKTSRWRRLDIPRRIARAVKIPVTSITTKAD